MVLNTSKDIASDFAQVATVLRDPRFWFALLCGGLALGIVGPFGTVTALPLGPRLAYWVFMVMWSGATGLILCRVLTRTFVRKGLPRLVAAPLSGLTAGLPINLIVYGVNTLLLPPNSLSIGPVALIVAIFAIAVFISTAVSEIFFAEAGIKDALPPPPPRPRLLNRLPAELDGELMSLTAIDHYTEITTTHGTTRLLLRLSDAMAEAAPTPGLRIHRSHWVALDHIRAARRDGPRASVTLTNGTELPVSRSNLSALEQTGLLPPR